MRQNKDKKEPKPLEELTFEEAMERLEEIVSQLDRGDLALEEAIKLFQEGTALRQICERKLAEAEAIVEQLIVPKQEPEEEEAQTDNIDSTTWQGSLLSSEEEDEEEIEEE